MTSCIIPGNVQNVVTEMRYGPGGQLVELIAKNPVTGDQVTRYEYGVTLADSAVASNRLLRAEVYPDAVDSSDRVKYSYNRQGQRTRMTDQNGSVHEYEHDLLGRQTADKVTTLGDGVDSAVRRIGTTYEVRGMVEKVTSYSDAAGTTPVNEVQNVYNSFGQLKEQYQEHSGAVNTGTTPKVQYAYADGSANTTRPTSMTYPNGRVLDYLYDDTHADKLSRVRTLRWDGTDVCRYAYLGSNTFVTTDYLQPQVKLDYALGSGANPYAGFDRFGRIIDLLWTKYGASSSSSSSSSSSGGPGNDLVHLKYGYDRASNRTFREDLVAQSYGKDFDELYEYDGLHRLKKFHRGRLTDDNRTITSPALQQGWQLDATGNWRNFTQNDQADASQTLDQQRLANRVNEITQIARTVGADWATPEYDRNGNMTVIPQPKDMESTFQGTWDAWNRLVKLTEPNGSGGWQNLAEYQYDGQTWRTAAKSYVSGVLDETRHFYFTSRWQDIEERLGTTPSSAIANRQFVWGQRYIDDLVLGNHTETTETTEYAFQDALWNAVAYFGDQGEIAVRFVYMPYGSHEELSATYGAIVTIPFVPQFRCTGHYSDIGSELIRFRFRVLHAAAATFLSRDPLAALSGSNLYLYVQARPTFFIDPFGLKELISENIVDSDGRKCGTVIVSIETAKGGPNKDKEGAYFKFDGSAEEKGCKCCASNHYGWIQHFRDSADVDWRYDNKPALTKPPSDPAKNPQPVDRPDKGDKPLSPSFANPGFPMGWTMNPWYGGPSDPDGDAQPIHKWEDIGAIFKGILSDVFLQTLKDKGIDPATLNWVAAAKKYWSENPFPQASIFDVPDMGQYITQLVCAGDAHGKGKDAGKVLIHFYWEASDISGSMKKLPIGMKP